MNKSLLAREQTFPQTCGILIFSGYEIQKVEQNQWTNISPLYRYLLNGTTLDLSFLAGKQSLARTRVARVAQATGCTGCTSHGLHGLHEPRVARASRSKSGKEAASSSAVISRIWTLYSKPSCKTHRFQSSTTNFNSLEQVQCARQGYKENITHVCSSIAIDCTNYTLKPVKYSRHHNMIKWIPINSAPSSTSIGEQRVSRWHWISGSGWTPWWISYGKRRPGGRSWGWLVRLELRRLPNTNSKDNTSSNWPGFTSTRVLLHILRLFSWTTIAANASFFYSQSLSI